MFYIKTQTHNYHCVAQKVDHTFSQSFSKKSKLFSKFIIKFHLILSYIKTNINKHQKKRINTHLHMSKNEI